MPATNADWTIDMLDALPEYVEPKGTGKVTISPSDVYRGKRKKNRVQPDVFVLRVIDGVTRAPRGDPGEVLSRRIEWRLNDTDAPFALDLPAFFDAALGANNRNTK